MQRQSQIYIQPSIQMAIILGLSIIITFKKDLMYKNKTAFIFASFALLTLLASAKQDSSQRLLSVGHLDCSSIPACQVCDDLGQGLECTACFGDWQLFNSGCIVPSDCGILIPGCVQCDIDASDDQVCLACDGNTVLYQNGCLQNCADVIQHCATCTSNDQGLTLDCSQCLGDWQLSSDFSACQIPANCSVLIDDCQTCNINANNDQQCLSCNGDKIISSNNACIFPELCSQSIANCGVCNDDDDDNQLTCTECLGDWQLDSETSSCVEPNDCNSIISGCQVCSIDIRSNQLICQQCRTGLNLSEDNRCICSIDGCTECGWNQLGQTICLSCGQLYDKSQDEKSCVLDCSLIQNCERCSLDNELFLCNECVGDWILQDNTCVAPDTTNCGQYIERCGTCSFTNNILTCNTCTNLKTPSLNRCAACRVTGCSVCPSGFGSGPQLCTNCQSGLSLNFFTTPRQCLACKPNCNTCVVRQLNRTTFTTICDSCASGYSLVNGDCVLNPPCDVSNCRRCSSPNICAQCNYRYALTLRNPITATNQCTRCPDRCLVCVAVSLGAVPRLSCITRE